jgi:hypothetical protein
MSGLNRDDIIRMAREAGVAGVTVYDEQSEADILHPDLEDFAKLVAAAEREACAEVAEKHFTYYGYQYIADDIRSRGQE